MKITNSKQYRKKVVSEKLYYKQLDIARVFENTKQVSQIVSISFEDYSILKSGKKTKEFRPLRRMEKGDSPTPIYFIETRAFLKFYGLDFMGERLLFYSALEPVLPNSVYSGFILQ